jgi:hypothetical protein
VWYSDDGGKILLLAEKPYFDALQRLLILLTLLMTFVNFSEKWAQQENLEGDFYIQNADAVQPGKIAPWSIKPELLNDLCMCNLYLHLRYQRYGHSMDAVDISSPRDNVTDIMVMLGGYAPGPVNEQWITADGNTWVYGFINTSLSCRRQLKVLSVL